MTGGYGLGAAQGGEQRHGAARMTAPTALYGPSFIHAIHVSERTNLRDPARSVDDRPYRPDGPNRHEFKALTSDGRLDGRGAGSSELLQRAFDPGPASTPDWAPDPWLEPPGASDSDSTPPEDWDSGA
jgi:hypothetical protein